jgi:multisubunit Na+/H+ antiporter MnhF subunit
MSPILWSSLALLSAAGASALIRSLRSGSLADRVLGIDFFITTVATGLVVAAVETGSVVYLPLVVVVALLAFIATASVARFIELRGA